jgi:hypothetical protein
MNAGLRRRIVVGSVVPDGSVSNDGYLQSAEAICRSKSHLAPHIRLCSRMQTGYQGAIKRILLYASHFLIDQGLPISP